MRMRVVMRVVMVIRMVGIDLLHLCVRHCTKLFTQIISFNQLISWSSYPHFTSKEAEFFRN